MDLFGSRQRIISEVSRWPQASVAHRRGGSVELQVGRLVFGQMVSDDKIDILLPKSMRVQLVLAGDAEPHPVMPRSGWITIYTNSEEGEERALKVLHDAYDVVYDALLVRPRGFAS